MVSFEAGFLVEEFLDFSSDIGEEDEEEDNKQSNSNNFTTTTNSNKTLSSSSSLPLDSKLTNSISQPEAQTVLDIFDPEDEHHRSLFPEFLEELEWITNEDAFPEVETFDDIFPGKLSKGPNNQSPVSVLENSSSSSNSGIMICCASLTVPVRGVRSKRRRRKRSGFSDISGQQWWRWCEPMNKNNGGNETIIGRKCWHCGAEKTPQWRAGPYGPKTLCNACGVRLLVCKMASSSRTSIETVKWNKYEVDTYVDILVEEVIKGNKTTCTFNKDGWSNIKNKMEEALGRPLSLKQLRNKLNKLRSEYGSFGRLVNTTGFGWNDTTKRVETHDPAIWDRHIQENPSWAKFRKNGLPQYRELQVIFGDSYATGEFACNNHDDNFIFEEGDADNLDNQDGSEVPPVEPTTDVTDEGDVHHTPQAAAAHRLDRTPSALRKRSRSTDIMGAINAMVEHSKARLDLFTTSHTSSASPSPSSISTGGYSITQCLAVLNTIPGLEKATYIKTMNHLVNNAEWRELFMGLDEEKKLWAIESIP